MYSPWTLFAMKLFEFYKLIEWMDGRSRFKLFYIWLKTNVLFEHVPLHNTHLFLFCLLELKLFLQIVNESQYPGHIAFNQIIMLLTVRKITKEWRKINSNQRNDYINGNERNIYNENRLRYKWLGCTKRLSFKRGVY